MAQWAVRIAWEEVPGSFLGKPRFRLFDVLISMYGDIQSFIRKTGCSRLEESRAMSDNNGDLRPDGYEPNADGENPVPNQAGSADETGASQWDGSATQSFQPEQGYPQDNQGFQPEGQGYGQPQYQQNQDTQSFQPEGQGHGQQAQRFNPEGQGYPDGTQSFQPEQGYPQDGQGYGQYPQVNNQDTQAFQPEGQGYQQGGYAPNETQAFGAQQPYAAPGYENQSYTTDQYNQSGYQPDQYGQQGYGHQAYPPSGQPAGGYQASYGGYDGTGGGGYPPYGGGYGQQPPKGKGPLIAWIVLGIILLGAIVVGVLFGTGFFDSDEDDAGPTVTEPLTVIPTTEDPTTAAPTISVPPTSSPAGYGDDPMLDGLWDQCADGDMVACDDLWYEADFDSEYYDFANTCGETAEASYGMCEYGLGSGTGSGEASSYGDDPILDELWDACEGGDFEACDELWWDTPIGSEYELFAESCGGRTDESASGTCVFRSEMGEF